MNHETNKLMGDPSDRELTKEEIISKEMSPEQAREASGQPPEPTKEELEKMTDPGTPGPSPENSAQPKTPTNAPQPETTDDLPEAGGDKQEPKLGDVMERVEVSVDALPIDLPEPRELTEGEQLAHTQTAYKALLEDFEKVSKQFAETKKEVEDCTKVNFGVRDILEVPESESILKVARTLKRELADLKEVPGDAIQVASLQGQVDDFKQRVAELLDERLTLLEAVKLKQQVIDKLEGELEGMKDAYEDLRSKTLKGASLGDIDLSSDVLTLRDNLESLLKQVDDLQEANRILRRRLQS